MDGVKVDGVRGPSGLRGSDDLLIILEHGGLICMGKDVIFKQVGGKN